MFNNQKETDLQNFKTDESLIVFNSYHRFMYVSTSNLHWHLLVAGSQCNSRNIPEICSCLRVPLMRRAASSLFQLSDHYISYCSNQGGLNSGLHKCPHYIICEVRSDAPNLSYLHIDALACVDDLSVQCHISIQCNTEYPDCVLGCSIVISGLNCIMNRC